MKEVHNDTMGKIVAPFKLKDISFCKTYDDASVSSVKAPHVLLIESLLTLKECEQLTRQLESQTWLPANYHGMRKNWQEGESIGSYRASSLSPQIAEILYTRMTNEMKILPDALEKEGWKAANVNPLMRFIKYPPKGKLFAHYDAPYVKDSNTRSLKSIVIYLHMSREAKGGETRFLKDPKQNEKNNPYLDWERCGNKKEILTSIAPKVGSALIFPHRMLHDGALVKNGEKILMRTDLMFTKND